jgi:type IV pilus biogenesis protein CpaD/CtpE
MSMKSAIVRWGVCAVVVLAMLAMLGGCAKKEAEQAETAAETTETAEPMASPMVGTYSADVAAGKATLTLNADMTAMMSMQPTDVTQPASVMNGNWAEGMSAVDVTFQTQMGDSTMSMTLNFAASGDTLSLTNGEAAGMGAVSLVKQHQH